MYFYWIETHCIFKRYELALPYMQMTYTNLLRAVFSVMLSSVINNDL